MALIDYTKELSLIRERMHKIGNQPLEGKA
jgi:hypothetical protein